MKTRILAGLTVLAVLGLGIFGAAYRGTYTDIAGQPDYLDQLMVAEMADTVVEIACKRLREELPDVPFVLRVSPVGGIEHLDGISRQRVRIEEVYTGSGLDAGEEIYLTAGRLIVNPSHAEKSLECGFVNLMKPGYEYLVFASGQVDTLKEEAVPVYWLYDETFIDPVFCYEDFQHVIVPISGSPTYVPYPLVRDNEFFADSEETLRQMCELKAELLAAYPKSS